MVAKSGAKSLPSQHLIYFADPMCSWCWGFSTVIDKISQSFSQVLPVRLILGGLRANESNPMSENDKALTRRHWEQVSATSGQSFNFDFFQRSVFVNNTEPACRAVVTARRLEPDKAMSMLRALQLAFYRENRDVTDLTELLRVAASQGFEANAFSAEFNNIDTMDDTRADFWIAQRSGINSFPTLLAVHNGQYQAVTIGFSPWEEVEPALKQWLQTR